jgi:signal-transduction protein with cAMP-binding, CBS, and nucleotidyltransferase domain
MRVEDLMSPAKCCREEDPVRDVARVMRDENIGFVPICSAANEPVGAITDRDLVIRVLAEGRSGEERISACMTRDVIGCRIGDDARSALQLMRHERRSRVMVCDDQGKLRGVISLADVAEMETDEETGETLQQVKSDQPAAH